MSLLLGSLLCSVGISVFMYLLWLIIYFEVTFSYHLVESISWLLYSDLYFFLYILLQKLFSWFWFSLMWNNFSSYSHWECLYWWNEFLVGSVSLGLVFISIWPIIFLVLGSSPGPSDCKADILPVNYIPSVNLYLLIGEFILLHSKLL